jgi:hypothetical protein
MVPIWHITILLTAFGIVGCTKRTGTSVARGKSLDQVLPTIIDEFGAESAVIKAGVGVTQVIRVASDGPIAGTALYFPTGSVLVDTELTLEEAAPVATARTTSELGIGESIAFSGIAVAIFAKDEAEPALPYRIELPIPPQTALQEEEADPSTLVIFYKVKLSAKDVVALGLIPLSELTVEGSTVTFSATHFGAFQAVFTKTLFSNPLEITTTTSIQTKREVLELVPFAITGRQPFVIKAGERVTITGTGFGTNLNMVIGGIKVLSPKIASESTATFLAPIIPRFGIVDLTADQDGTEQTITLLYRGLKTDKPVIMLTEPEVCGDQQYYDASGAAKAGTRICDAPIAASLTDLSEPVLRPQTCPRSPTPDGGRTIRLDSENIPSNSLDKCQTSHWQIGGIDSGSKFGFCNEADDQCTYQDLQTGKYWSKHAPTNLSWIDAEAYCAGTISEQSDWRLPTLDELNQAAIDGIASTSSENFIVIDNATAYWTSTTDPGMTTRARSVNIAAIAAEWTEKNKLRAATCVRP